MIQTYQTLLEKYSKYSNPKTKIARLVKNKELIHIGKGLYEDNPNIDPILLSSIIYSPSYVSFETALSIYNLIPERVYNITCATFNKNKRKEYHTPYCIFIYEDVDKKAFPFGTKMIEENGYMYIIACKEKALLDKLSKTSPLSNYKEMRDYLFDNLRINELILNEFDKNMVKQLSELYKSRNVKLFAKMYIGGKLYDK